MAASPFYRPTVAEIDLDALTHNVEFFRNRIAKNTEIMAVVKADAYGHGAIPVAKHLQTIGIRNFAVAFLDEAIQLRQGGILDPILVMGYTPKEGIEAAIKQDITLTIFSEKVIEQIDLVGQKLNKKLKVHVKVDTGMGRVGLFPEDLKAFFSYARNSTWVDIIGIFTHFATADEKDKTFTIKQYNQFIKAINSIDMIKSIPFIHVSNSAAMIDLPELKQTMSRLGISLYGLLPSHEVNILPTELKPVMSIKTEIVYVKKIRPGQTVSYGATFKAERDTMVATLPIGYADGLSRGLSNKGYVLIHGQRAPIIGRVCMDQTMIDVTDVPMVNIGDEVVIIGKQDNEILRLDEHAQLVGTINYELATLVGKRIPRVFRKNGKIIEVINNLLKLD